MSLVRPRLYVWFIFLPDKIRPHVAVSESDGCTKYESLYPSMNHTGPDHESDMGHNVNQIQKIPCWSAGSTVGSRVDAAPLVVCMVFRPPGERL